MFHLKWIDWVVIKQCIFNISHSNLLTSFFNLYFSILHVLVMTLDNKIPCLKSYQHPCQVWFSIYCVTFSTSIHFRCRLDIGQRLFYLMLMWLSVVICLTNSIDLINLFPCRCDFRKTVGRKMLPVSLHHHVEMI